MTRAPTRPEPSTYPDAPEQTDSRSMLSHAVEEAARLLQADGAMVYLVDDGVMRFAVDAGIRNPEAQQLIRDLSLPIGVGLFGHAVASGELVVSGDYRRDKRFRHSPVADRIVQVANMRSMAAAPLIADGEVLGALGAYSSRIDDFNEAGLALLRALADHAAAAIANQRLIERLARSQAELARRVDTQRTLGEIAARIAVIREPEVVLQKVVEAARRLIGSDAAHLTLMLPGGRLLRPTVVVGGNAAWTEEWLAQLEFPVDGGINGLAAGSGETVWTEDYLVDPRIPHDDEDQAVAGRLQLRGMAAAPLRGPEGEVIGTLAVSFDRPHTFGADELELLQGLADQGAIAIANARLTEDLRQHGDELAHRVEAQRTLAEMAAQLTSLRDPSAVLTQTLKEAVRLLKGQGGQIGMVVTDANGTLRWGDGHSLVHGRLVPFTKEDHTRVDDGVSGRAVREGRVSWTDDYLADDSFPHDPASDEIARKLGIRAVIAAPLIAEGGAVGAIGVYAEHPAAFDADAGELLGLLADQAVIVLTNARLNAEAEVSAAQLAHRVEAQRTLGEIAASITSLRDASAVLRRTIDEARRLLEADHVVIHQLRPGSPELADYREVANPGPDTPAIDGVTVSIGQGIAGRAIEQRTVTWTGDYLADRSFPHTERADEWIGRFGYRSQMSAPLIGEEGALGAISAYSTRPDAFAEDDSQLLGALASQAAIVLGNARLYEELERRIEAQRSLGEIAARITAIREPGDVLQRTLDEAVRLIDADGGRIELVAEGGGLHWAFGHSAIDLPIERADGEAAVSAEEGVSGRAVRERRVVLTGDYLADESFTHADAPDRYIRQHGIRSVMSAPLIGEEGAIGSLTVHSQAREAFDPADAELLEVLASQAAIAVTNARLYEQLRERIDAQKTMAAISAEIVALRDPAAVLQRTVDEALRLLRADSAIINPLEADDALLGWPIAYAPADEPADDLPVRMGEGISGRAMSEGRVLRTGNYLEDPAFDHTEELDAYIRRRGMSSVMTAPLISTAGSLGALTVQAARDDAFNEGDVELLRLLADQAAIAITNARLYEQLGQESAALARQTDSQRRLLDISRQLLSTLEPASVLEVVADGLKSVVWYDNLGVYRIDESGSVLEPVFARDRNADAVLGFPIPKGQGLTWSTVENREPVLANDALSDPRLIQIPGTPLEEEAIIIVPLVSGDDVIGAMNISRTGGAEVAFTDADFELVQLFATQAAVAITNARLYEELEESERRYRHLVDNSPDIVWSVDADGRFTFFSDSLEARTGWKPEQLIGQPFTALAGEETLAAAATAWEQLRADPDRERRVRLDLPLPDGRISQTEVAMTGTVVDGRFAGAHGSVRDISERERLEGDLRSQAAELAASQERAHLARELHDSVTQALFSMGLTLRTMELLLQTDAEAAREKVAELRELQKDALAEMRTLIFELRPSSLESDGLVQALRTHATAVQRRTGLAIVVDAEPVERLPLSTEEALYRIGQEALHNVVKHANASHATIRIVREGDRVRLSVTDDGAGFQPGEVPRGHLGLIGMRQRVDLVGGDLRVESEPGRGTLVEASVPGGEAPSAE